MSPHASQIDMLVRRAVAGDEAAIGELLERHRPYLKVVARRSLDSRLGPRIDDSDVVQQTLLSAFGNFGNFRGETGGDFLAWLRVLHERNLRDAARAHLGAERRNVNREVPGGDPARDRRVDLPPKTASQRLLADEDAVQLARALDALPPHQHEAVRLRYLEGWCLEDVAARMEITLPAVAGLLKRGLKALRIHLRSTGEP
jgi:RNA polymerase sigma-70 factor, ECF subfamily